jgi:hypothetical protein
MMNEKATMWAAAAVLSIGAAAPALAGSVTQPGDTMGTPVGAPIPPGVFFANQTNWGCSDTSPRTCVLTDIPILVGSTPWKILGGSLAFATAPTTWVDVDINNVHHDSGLFNPFAAGELTWNLGHEWGFTYLLGAYFDVDSEVAYSSTSLNQRFGLSYTGNGWDLTANVIWGIQFDQVTRDPQGFPCPVQQSFGCNPNFINVDLTATKRFGKWESGPIGFYATDISTPVPEYRRQSKAAIGGLVAYWFDTFILQVYGTTEFYEENYGGKDSRLWSRIVIPLGKQPATRPIAQ